MNAGRRTRSPLRIDREEYEQIAAELIDMQASKYGDITIVRANHEDHGHVHLMRKAGRFYVEANETSFIRPFGTMHLG